MTDQPTPTIRDKIDALYWVEDFENVDEYRKAALELLADFAERITPEKVDLQAKYETTDGVNVIVDEDNMNITGDNLTHLASYASDQGYNEAIDTITQNVKAELGAAPINSKEVSNE